MGLLARIFLIGFEDLLLGVVVLCRLLLSSHSKQRPALELWALRVMWARKALQQEAMRYRP